MLDHSKVPERGRLERFRERRRDRKQRRAWRRERRKGDVNLYNASNKAESSLMSGGFFKKD